MDSMIQVLILEDNIFKVHKLIDSEYLKFQNKAWAVTAHEMEAERLMRHNEGRAFEAVYLDYELGPGCGDGMNFLRQLTKENVGKVYCISMNKEIAREMHTYCRDRGIPFEYLRL
jgi:hypothetical protein